MRCTSTDISSEGKRGKHKRCQNSREVKIGRINKILRIQLGLYIRNPGEKSLTQKSWFWWGGLHLNKWPVLKGKWGKKDHTPPPLFNPSLNQSSLIQNYCCDIASTSWVKRWQVANAPNVVLTILLDKYRKYIQVLISQISHICQFSRKHLQELKTVR